MSKLQCLQHHDSERFIKKIIRNGAIIHKTDLLPVYSSSFAKGRSLSRVVKYLTRETMDGLQTGKPFFIMFQLRWTESDDKHSTSLFINESNDRITLWYFDPNGPLSDTFMNDRSMRTLLESIQQELQQLSEKEVSLQYVLSHNINTIGQGNCDAISLFFVSKVLDIGIKAVRSYFNKSLAEILSKDTVEARRQIQNINNYIVGIS